MSLNDCLATCAGKPCAAPTTSDGGATSDAGATPDVNATPDATESDGGSPPPAHATNGSGCALAAGADPVSAWGIFAIGALALISLRSRRR
jgi:hypothetical protein